MARILVVEDNEELAQTLADWLTFEGHEVVLAYDGLEAAKYIDDNSFDLILLDWVMPGRSGIEVCRNYRMAGGTSPVIMITGKVSLDNKEIGFDAGADDYIVKPFNLKELSWRMRSWLRRSFRTFPVVMPTAVEKQEVRTMLCEKCDAAFDTTVSVCPDDRTALVETTVEYLAGAPLSGNFVIAGVLGRGAMGTVFKVWQKQEQQMFALKLLDTSHLRDPSYVKRFQGEGATLKKLKHDNIIGIHDYGVTDIGQPFIVMDYVEGKSLGRILNRGEKFALKRFVQITRQIADGIGYAHSNGVVHRDLKPANVLLAKKLNKEHVNILDFGVARLILENDDGSCEDLRLTRSGEIFGTAMYMSPEQCLGRQLDARSDIYALGCLMYEMLCGQPPLVGRNVLETLNMQINEVAPPLRSKIEVPELLERIVQKAMSKDPAKRFSSMEELSRSLEKCAKEA
jgi:DNA-binding response OmpR family regulator/predicted Ser/Thr protein kinase